MQQSKKDPLTSQMHERLTKRLRDLEDKLSEETKDLTNIAREEKDSTGNPALNDAHRRIDLLQGQINEINYQLDNSVIVPEDNDPILTVSVGNKVVLHVHRNGKEERIEAVIDGVCDYCGDGKVISPNSPMGAAVIGAAVGEERQFSSPSGAKIQIMVISVSHC